MIIELDPDHPQIYWIPRSLSETHTMVKFSGQSMQSGSDPDPNPDHSQNIIGCSLARDTPLVMFHANLFIIL